MRVDRNILSHQPGIVLDVFKTRGVLLFTMRMILDWIAEDVPAMVMQDFKSYIDMKDDMAVDDAPLPDADRQDSAGSVQSDLTRGASSSKLRGLLRLSSGGAFEGSSGEGDSLGGTPTGGVSSGSSLDLSGRQPQR
jgi:hypothetical protein